MAVYWLSTVGTLVHLLVDRKFITDIPDPDDAGITIDNTEDCLTSDSLSRRFVIGL